MLARVDKLTDVAGLAVGAEPVNVADVEKARTVESDVDERGLHTGHHAGNPAVVEVACEAVVAASFQVQLAKLAIGKDRDARLEDAYVDEDLFQHRAFSPYFSWISLERARPNAIYTRCPPS